MIRDSSNKQQSRAMKIKKDYHSKEFINPYFNQQNRGFNVFLYLKILALILLIYLAVYSDLFKIKQVDITGLKMIDQSELETLVNQQLDSWRWRLLPQRNLLLMDRGLLAEKITSQYNLNNLTLNKGWKKLAVIVEEKVSFLIVYNQHNFYFVDEEGRVTTMISEAEAQEYWQQFPLLNIGEQSLAIGDQVISAKAVDFLIKLDEELKLKPVPIYGYEARAGEEVALVAKQGWRGIFSVDSDPRVALDNLLLILTEKVEDQNQLEYIDVRFGDKVFYK
ncbi:MAG TPA: cell division protein FtsQ/DivIB [bacterium]|nr:cell division protein FtsQ/DivIB [bacterium]HPN81393.1 cell division protein FtsQ/DivIB [bacterium]HPW39119.1 cell division protein FtsQ/DivIB [bacterium]